MERDEYTLAGRGVRTFVASLTCPLIVPVSDWACASVIVSPTKASIIVTGSDRVLKRT
jgi:hypothetical protein